MNDMGIKTLGKTFLSILLEAQVKKLRTLNQIKVIAVVGSVGKTTTKLAIVKTLEPHIKLQHQAGNYNDRLTVPLVFFGQVEPDIYNILAWIKLLWANQRMLRKPYPYDLIVLELGADGPGQLKHFAYTKPDILVVTALTDEHMLYFKTLDAVAAEELSVANFSEKVLINSDDAAAKYVVGLTHLSYGTTSSDYTLQSRSTEISGHQLLQVSLNGNLTTLQTSLLGVQGAKAALAAAAVADMIGLTQGQIERNIMLARPVSGRMQLLRGINSSIIIDDSYNASPIAMKAALDVLYEAPVEQRIAVLGSMNEMGNLSQSMHEDVGRYCHSSKLALVITIGHDANTYLAPIAQANGCVVQKFSSPYDAGDYIRKQLGKKAAVLVKGSQNGVFSEETVKLLLADQSDSDKLVRQSTFWLNQKRRQFGR